MPDNTAPAPVMLIKQQRKPRYRRAAGEVNFHLQERDLKIIEIVYKHRFIPSDYIAALVTGSKQGILRRLSFLFHAGYLDRPPEQIKPFTVGTNPMVYGLGNKGADILHEVMGIPRSNVDWTTKNRDVKRLYLEHTLMISAFSASLKLACDRHSGIEIIELERIVKGEPILKVNINREFKGKTLNLRFDLAPDRVFGLRFNNDASDKNRAFFFLEADRSTMPVVRNNFFRPSYYKKMLGYWHCRLDGSFKRTFGFENARVLTLAISQERISHMIEACKAVDESNKGSGMFLFTLASNFTLNNIDNILKPIWRNGRDDKLVGLMD